MFGQNFLKFDRSSLIFAQTDNCVIDYEWISSVVFKWAVWKVLPLVSYQFLNIAWKLTVLWKTPLTKFSSNITEYHQMSINQAYSDLTIWVSLWTLVDWIEHCVPESPSPFDIHFLWHGISKALSFRTFFGQNERSNFYVTNLLKRIVGEPTYPKSPKKGWRKHSRTRI